jgi:uncharacterized caspase-like protein
MVDTKLNLVAFRHSVAAVFVALALLLLAWPSTAQEPKSLNGVALVIGQSAYANISPLPNPANDAREMVKLLTDLGFDARGVTDRDAGKLRRDLERFAEDAEGADVALLYYSGHGIEAAGDNWLVPVDAGPAALDSADEALVSLSSIIDELKKTVPVTIVLLDACRTNPFPPGATLKRTPTGSAEPVGAGGLGPVRGVAAFKNNAPANDNLGMVIGFAAEPGEPALDGEAGGNSPYAAALLRHLAAMKGVEFGQVMRMVTEEVYLATKARQRPWMNESLRRLLYFGMAPEEPEGIDRTITGERRQLLLTMADLPDVERVQVEQVAAREGVRLDSLYGILRALGEDAAPRGPEELGKLLDQQAGRLKSMMAERAALRTDDPELVALADAADRAIEEGAIVSARRFLDDAVARVEQTSAAVDALEDQVKDKRIADAAIYARRADAATLAFDFVAAAGDYAKAFDLVEKWDERLSWNYKNLEAEALLGHGDATADRAALDRALAAYQTVLNMLPNGEKGRDWAITKNNMAVVLNTIGEREESNESLTLALATFREAMEIFTAENDDANWAAAQNNIGNILLVMGGRAGDFDMIGDAVAAYRAALAKRPRDKVPLDWASSQNNIGIALFQKSEPRGDPVGLAEAESSYRAALEVFTRDATPVDWSLVQNNLGNTLNALGLAGNDPERLRQAAEAFNAAMTVRTREQWPFQWATSQLNLGNALNNLGRHELGTDSVEQARAAYENALSVFDRTKTPLDWASGQNNLGSALQTIGQRTQDFAMLEKSAEAFRDARKVYKRKDFPLDWAMTQNNLGNTLQLMATVSGDPKFYREAVEAFDLALREYRRDRAPMQWALATASMGNALQYLSNSEEDTKSLHASVAARRAALEVLTADNAPVEWATAQNGLGMSLLNLSTREQNPAFLQDAKAAFEASTQVFTRETQPMQWAFAQNNIGDVHWALGAQARSEAEYRQALVMFEQAKEAFQQAGYAPLIELIDKKIALVREHLPN